ncbi:hypothetical protein CEXT_152201 [Caerostris extrusa]|uniref:Uncharacterized protein n=1 Tax=Caerostris extrusa TaxID=172846 RepID=A0AAV4NFS3_CAEEX|nr:hypothetical protein CEXT_152201 [Caerostris extrusa]
MHSLKGGLFFSPLLIMLNRKYQVFSPPGWDLVRIKTFSISDWQVPLHPHPPSSRTMDITATPILPLPRAFHLILIRPRLLTGIFSHRIKWIDLK